MMTSAYSLTSEDWKTILANQGQSLGVLEYVLDGLYKNPGIWKKHLSPVLIESLQSKFSFHLPKISHVHESEDGTFKFLMAFEDLLEVETVLIPFHKRYTVCLSTQVGCAMNCSFCYTGTQGLKRNLKTSEIVGQYIVASQFLKDKGISEVAPSIVFMGQGEPLHNVEEVKKAVEVLNDRKTLGVGNRQMTLSTVGYLPGISKLKSFPQINFALSLHSPFEEERSKLIPMNQRFPLKEVLMSLDEIPLLKKQFITYEYLLIKNFNMSDAHADELALLLSHRKAIINLIPFNPYPGSEWERPSILEVEEFKQKLVAHRLRVMVRTTKGDDILAACGQLKIKKLARNNGNS